MNQDKIIEAIKYLADCLDTHNIYLHDCTTCNFHSEKINSILEPEEEGLHFTGVASSNFPKPEEEYPLNTFSETTRKEVNELITKARTEERQKMIDEIERWRLDEKYEEYTLDAFSYNQALDDIKKLSK